MYWIDPDIRTQARRVHSQFEEDGIIEAVMRSLRIERGYYVEFGVGPRLPHMLETDGIEANTRLLKEKGWAGLWMDGNVWPTAHGAQVEWISVMNINLLLRKYKVPEDFDLISIDVDGQDHWLWMALDAQPKVVVIECNGNFDLDDSRVMPFDLQYRWDGTEWFGASVTALYKIGLSKNYQMVWTNAFNCVFVRDDLIQNPGDFQLQRIHERLNYKMHEPDHLARPWIVI